MTRHGLVVAGHHAAADAGAQVLREGGNAMDAAVTAAAVLTVALPHMNGLGGDAFALWFNRDTDEIVAINGSGGAPAMANIETYRGRNLSAVPARGPLSISVPGAVHAWSTSLERYGTISLSRALAPAISLAEGGLPLDRTVCDFLNGEIYASLVKHNPVLGDLFGEPGRFRHGDTLQLQILAQTLRAIVDGGADVLYGGHIGDALVKDLAAIDALICIDDLARHRTLLQAPLSTKFRGHAVYAAPPNTQGLALIVLLGLLEIEDKNRDREPDESFPCRFLRLKHAAFAQRDRYVGDPDVARVPNDLLTANGLRDLARASSRHAPSSRTGASPKGSGGDTTCVVVMDGKGNAVSWVQSLFEEFGSGVASPSTGIVLHNRLSLASMEPETPNTLGPGRRPFHTLCPALFVRDGVCRLAIATPGDHGQPQTIAQVALNLFDRGMDAQAAVEAPRFRHDQGREVMCEDRCEPIEKFQLEAVGYRIRSVGSWSRIMGGVDAIDCPDGLIRMGAADPRRAAYAVAQ